MTYRPFGFFRLVLAVLVIVQHFGANLASPEVAAVAKAYVPGTLAVLVFFILSGFMIGEAAHRSYAGRPVAFLSNRALRLLPPLFVALLFSFAVHVWFVLQQDYVFSLEQQVLTEKDLLPAPILIGNALSFLPGMRVVGLLPEHGLIPYLWTIRAEVAFYLVLAFGLWVVRGYRTVLVLLMLGVFAAQQLGLYGLPPLLGFTPYFLAGLGLYHRNGPLLALSLAGIVWHAALHVVNDPYVGGLFLFLIIWFLALSDAEKTALRLGKYTKLYPGQGRARGNTAKSNTAFDRFCGDLSYPLYLNHYAVGVIAINVFPERSDALAIGSFLVSLLISWILERVTEEPLKRLRDKIRGHKV